MTTRTRPKRNATSKRYNDDWEQTPLTKSVKTSVKETTTTQKKKTNAKSSPATKTSDAEKKSRKTTSPLKTKKKQKTDTHAFSSYFESKRDTVRYNYHISPVAKLCIGSPVIKPKPKAVQRKRKKGDVFDFCSDDEEMSVIPTKKSKMLPPQPITDSKASTKKTKPSVSKPNPEKSATVTKKTEKPSTAAATARTMSKPSPTKSAKNLQKKLTKQESDTRTQQVP